VQVHYNEGIANRIRPGPCAGHSRGCRRNVGRGTRRPAIEPRRKTDSGCRRYLCSGRQHARPTCSMSYCSLALLHLSTNESYQRIACLIAGAPAWWTLRGDHVVGFGPACCSTERRIPDGGNHAPLPRGASRLARSPWRYTTGPHLALVALRLSMPLEDERRGGHQCLQASLVEMC
jgi:hypothetical protein